MKRSNSGGGGGGGGVADAGGMGPFSALSNFWGAGGDLMTSAMDPSGAGGGGGEGEDSCMLERTLTLRDLPELQQQQLQAAAVEAPPASFSKHHHQQLSLLMSSMQQHVLQQQLQAAPVIQTGGGGRLLGGRGGAAAATAAAAAGAALRSLQANLAGFAAAAAQAQQVTARPLQKNRSKAGVQIQLPLKGGASSSSVGAEGKHPAAVQGSLSQASANLAWGAENVAPSVLKQQQQVPAGFSFQQQQVPAGFSFQQLLAADEEPSAALAPSQPHQEREVAGTATNVTSAASPPPPMPAGPAIAAALMAARELAMIGQKHGVRGDAASGGGDKGFHWKKSRLL